MNKNGMTFEQAKHNFGEEDLESSTCSVICKMCNGRVWFGGSLEDHTQMYLCPHCGYIQRNRLLGKRRGATPKSVSLVEVKNALLLAIDELQLCSDEQDGRFGGTLDKLLNVAGRM
jgi:DNA-directed RNA polymerase subunit RPC12/RpoP